jgi:hypothetical protein
MAAGRGCIIQKKLDGMEKILEIASLFRAFSVPLRPEK